MTKSLTRADISPDNSSLATADWVIAGRKLAETVRVAPCPFLEEYDVVCEADFKRSAMAAGMLTRHAQIGYRDVEKSRRAWSEIHRRLSACGVPLHRYGICLDWSMGYPARERKRFGRGTGLILDRPDSFRTLTQEAPVAPHFGDFVIGTPAALENTVAALQAGATAIGNLGQYFTFRMPGWSDEVATTAETVKALSLIAAQPVECLIHSNLDDGFASLFTDMACALGAVLIEKYIVDDLLGGRVSHCYGHTYTDGVKRHAFLRALAEVSDTPGTMVYGATMLYGDEPVANWASLSAYFLVDTWGQQRVPTGHALNPVPITEAIRIPEIDDVVEAHLVADRLIERANNLAPFVDFAAATTMARDIVAGGQRFRDRVLEGLDAAGIDIHDAGQVMFAIRRVGARRLEDLFGPGEREPTGRRERRSIVGAPGIDEIEAKAACWLASLSEERRDRLAGAGLTGLVVSTDVHEYGKILIGEVLDLAGIAVADGGVHGDPEDVVEALRETNADFIAVSTYNGVALDYLTHLRREMRAHRMDVPVFIGGKLNQIPEGSNTSLPVGVETELAEAGAIVCRTPEDMLAYLAMTTAEDE